MTYILFTTSFSLPGIQVFALLRPFSVLSSHSPLGVGMSVNPFPISTFSSIELNGLGSSRCLEIQLKQHNNWSYHQRSARCLSWKELFGRCNPARGPPRLCGDIHKLWKEEVTHPAEAARTSWRLALVKADSTAATIRVNARTTPMEPGLVAIFPAADILKRSQTGTMSRTKIRNVIIIVTQ